MHPSKLSHSTFIQGYRKSRPRFVKGVKFPSFLTDLTKKHPILNDIPVFDISVFDIPIYLVFIKNFDFRLLSRDETDSSLVGYRIFSQPHGRIARYSAAEYVAELRRLTFLLLLLDYYM